MPRYSARLNGFTSFAITWVDVIGGLDAVTAGTRYLSPSGETLKGTPQTIAEDYTRLTPGYERLPNWPKLTERLGE